jgi:pilus assembly protein CpaC
MNLHGMCSQVRIQGGPTGGRIKILVWTSRRSTSLWLIAAVGLAPWLATAGLLVTGLGVAPARGGVPETFENVVVGRPTIDLDINEGRLVRFDGPVESVFLANPAIADLRVVAPDVIYIYGKKSGSTNLIAWSAEQKVRVEVQFRVSASTSPPNEALRKLQPTATQTISLFGDRAAVTGKARTIEQAVDSQNVGETYNTSPQPPINNSTIEGSQQVNIRVRFAEVQRAELQQLGFNWKVFGGAGASSVGLAGGKIDIEVLLEAMHRQGLVNILAEPNLTAVSGQQAEFLAGGEVPVMIPQSGGTNTVEYKQYGVSLQFTPTIIATDRIALHVRPQVSSIAHTGEIRINNVDMPAFTVRRADTTVEVASGETFAIAGLFQRQYSQDLDKLPGLGEVPVLGALFTSDHYLRNESELVILITSYLVKPMRGRAGATPLDRLPPPVIPAAQAPPPAAAAPPRNVPRSGLILK